MADGVVIYVDSSREEVLDRDSAGILYRLIKLSLITRSKDDI